MRRLVGAEAIIPRQFRAGNKARNDVVALDGNLVCILFTLLSTDCEEGCGGV